MDQPAPVSFRRDVIPAFSQASCNMGACHGTPTGKGGFRLSLRGYLPDQDFAILSREAGGRRINPIAPETSLILRKPLGEVPHEGGLRLARNSKSYEFLHDWIKEGAKDDPPRPRPFLSRSCRRRACSMPRPAPSRSSSCVRGADKTVRDVTPICYYDSSNPAIAEVDADGYVRFKARGEVAIIAHYLNLVANVRLTHLVEVPGFVQATVPDDNLIDQAVFEKLNRMRIAPSQTLHRPRVHPPHLPRCLGILPTPDEVRAFLADSPADSPRPRHRPAARSSRVLRLLGPQVRRRAPLERSLDPDQGGLRLPSLDSRVPGAQSADGPVGPRVVDFRRINLQEPGRPTITASAATPKRPSRPRPSSFWACAFSAPSAITTRSSAGRRTTITGSPPSSRRSAARKAIFPEEEVVYATGSGDVNQPRTGRKMEPKALGGPVLDDPATKDRRIRLATWLASPGNPFFAKSLVNRIWFHLIGRGIVEPVDDFRDSNPSSNDALLEGLAADFVKNGYDLKKLIRSILHSRTYQLSATTNSLNVDDSLYFSHAQTRLLPAEVLARRDLDRHQHHDVLRRTSPRRTCHANPGRQDGEPFLEDVRPARPRAGLRMRAGERLQPLPGTAVNRRGDRSTASSATTTAAWPSLPRRASRPSRSRGSSTWSPSAATRARPSWRPPPSTSPRRKISGRPSRTSAGC